MSRYAEVECENPAPSTFTVRREHWASSFKERPVEPVKLGIRLLSDSDLTYAQSIAREMTERYKMPETRALVTAAVSIAICNPANASLAHDAFQSSDEDVIAKLRPETIQAIYDALELLMLETSPLFPEATDEEIVALVETLEEDGIEAIDSLPDAKRARIRRLLRFCLDELN